MRERHFTSTSRARRRATMLGAACAIALASSPGAAQQFAQLVPASTTARVVTATLRGTGAIPGDPDGVGLMEMTLDSETGRLCYELSVSGIAPATTATLHGGSSAASVLTFDTPNDGHSSGCLTIDRALASRLARQPRAFTVHVANAEFPDGALRGAVER